TAFALSPLCGALSLVALPLALGYSLAKRFTWLCHFWLGVVLALAPVGAYLAVAGTLDAFPLLLGAGVICWIAGFDITYALADLEVDRREGLHSFPVRWGPRPTLLTSKVLHLLAPAFFLIAGLSAGRGIASGVGVAMGGAARRGGAYGVGVALAPPARLWGEIATARGARGDAARTANGWVSLLFGAAAVVDVIFVGVGP